jgi:hypothetical protein
VNFLGEMPPGFIGMVNGWLSRDPRKNPGAEASAASNAGRADDGRRLLPTPPRADVEAGLEPIGGRIERGETATKTLCRSGHSLRKNPPGGAVEAG